MARHFHANLALSSNGLGSTTSSSRRDVGTDALQAGSQAPCSALTEIQPRLHGPVDAAHRGRIVELRFQASPSREIPAATGRSLPGGEDPSGRFLPVPYVALVCTPLGLGRHAFYFPFLASSCPMANSPASRSYKLIRANQTPPLLNFLGKNYI